MNLQDLFENWENVGNLIAEQLPEKEAMDTMNELDGSVKHLRNTLNNVVGNFPNHSGVQNWKILEGNIESFWTDQRNESILKAGMIVVEALIIYNLLSYSVEKMLVHFPYCIY